MAAIEYSPTLYSTCLVLTKEEALRIQPLVLKGIAQAREKMDFYQDRIDGGYATKKEENLCMKYSDSYRELSIIAHEIDNLISY